MVSNPYINLEDKELMLKYQDGDHMAFDVLYLRHKDKVYSYLAKRLHTQSHIDDTFQKVFVKFHKSRNLYSDKYEVLPWIYTITKSIFLDAIKSKQIESTEFREQDHPTIDHAQESLIELDEQKVLNKKEKEALTQRYYNDKDFAEIAQILETSESNVRKIISRGIKKLRLKLKGENHE